MRLFLFLTFFFLPVELLAQVNAEAFRGSSQGGFSGQAQLSLGFFTGNVNQISSDTTLRIDYLTPDLRKLDVDNHHVFFVGNHSIGKAKDVLYKDSLFGHLRWVRSSSFATTEYFLQSQYDQFRDLKQRSLGGVGLREEFFLITTFVAFGVGVMAEYEEILSQNSSSLVARSTNYFSMVVDKNPFAYNFVAYYQPLVTDYLDFRVSAESQLILNVSKTLGLAWSLKFLYDSRPPPNVKKLDLTSSFNLKYDF